MFYKAEGLNHLNISAYTANLNNLFSELTASEIGLLYNFFGETCIQI